jgi:hypothetical protein
VRTTRVVAAAVLVGAAAEAFHRFRRWHLAWGATDDEALSVMPGDAFVPKPHFAPTRAITIDAPPDEVWPWLEQLGYGRAGWYSYDLLDNLGRKSADQIRVDLQGLRAGDRIPMGPVVTDETAWVVDRIDPPHEMVWTMPSSSWAWRLEALPGDRTRLVTRIRLRYRLGPTLPLELVLLEIGDFWMMRKELRSIKELVERGTVAAPIAA